MAINKKISDMLSVRDILSSETALTSLIISEERNDFVDFLFKVKGVKENDELNNDDFELFRNGFVINTILQLQKIAKRELQSSEMIEKINYLALVPDVESLNRSYTDPKLIDGLVANIRDFSFWFNSGIMDSLPIETKNKIAIELLNAGDIDKATKALKSIDHDLEKFREDQTGRANTRV